MLAGTAALLVRLKLAAVATPPTEVVTVYGPVTPLAVKVADVATPLELLTAVVTPPAKVPLAPLPGGTKFTVMPEIGLLNESFTVTWSGEPNAVLTVALWGVPPVAEKIGAPGLFVRLKLAGVPTPATVAATV
jgi:hypothetical protein